MTVKWGALRFDARVGAPNNEGVWSNACLGITDFQGRIPKSKNAVISGPGSVAVNVNTVEDQDAYNAWAAACGLDYWIFDMYPIDPQLGIGGTYTGSNYLNHGLTRFLASTNRCGMKFCVMPISEQLGTAAPGDPTYGYGGWATNTAPFLVNCMRDTSWLTINGRPMVYMWDYGRWATWGGGTGTAANMATAVSQFRTLCTTASPSLASSNPNISDPNPYLVGMHNGDVSNFATIGYDAYTNYAAFFGVGAPFNHAIAASSHPGNNTYASMRTWAEGGYWDGEAARGYPYIPQTTTGLDYRSENNPTAFSLGLSDYGIPEPAPIGAYYPTIRDGDGAWLEYPTDTELAAHIKAGIDWCEAHPSSCPPEKHMITYAWNECEESGRCLVGDQRDNWSGMAKIGQALGRSRYRLPRSLLRRRLPAMLTVR